MSAPVIKHTSSIMPSDKIINHTAQLGNIAAVLERHVVIVESAHFLKYLTCHDRISHSDHTIGARLRQALPHRVDYI